MATSKIGGATLVSNMINADLIDEIRLLVHPILLGGGKALFAGVTERRSMKLESVTTLQLGEVYVTYKLDAA